MDPEDPSTAQQIVAAYAAVLERHEEAQTFPASRSQLPYSTDVIKTAIRTSAFALASTGHLTGELRTFLEAAYVALADFVDDELVRLLNEYNRAAEELTSEPLAAGERMKSTPWQTLQRTGGLAGEIAKNIAADAAQLKAEFRELDIS